MMDRVLSYQTAVRAGTHETSGFDIRQYISKRTCISMTLSIAFIALIFGFLLGKFTSDRNHIIKERRPTTHRPIIIENEVDRVIHSVIDALRIRQAADDQVSEHKDDAITGHLTFLRTNFTDCLSDNNNQQGEEAASVEDSLSSFLRNHHNIYLKCARNLRNILLLSD